MPPAHRTPLRRTSHSSLFGLSRSSQLPESTSNLEFIESAMEEFVEETARLRANYEGIAQLDETLHVFNDAFASWLYVMDMNALTTDWPQAPTEISFQLAQHRSDQNAISAAKAAKEAARAASEAKASAEREAQAELERTIAAETTQADVTYATTNTSRPTATKKKVVKAKLSAKEKRERSLEIERIISALPLEFRGNEPTLRKNMESVIIGLLNASNMCAKITDLITPECNQARVNKCLIALVNRKVVHKESSTGAILYHWRGLP